MEKNYGILKVIVFSASLEIFLVPFSRQGLASHNSGLAHPVVQVSEKITGFAL